MNINEIIKKEENHKDFEYKGYKCHIHRNPSMLFLCGYVEIPKGNKFYGSDGENMSVHGGITFYGDHLPYSDEKIYDNWVLGFDCAHAGDYINMTSTSVFSNLNIYRDMEYVENEIKQLVDQMNN